MRPVRHCIPKVDDFIRGSELDEEIDLLFDDDGDVLEDDEMDVDDEQPVGLDKEEDSYDSSSSSEEPERIVEPTSDDGWIPRDISHVDELAADYRPKSSFLAARPLGFQGKTTASDFVLEFLRPRFFELLWTLARDHQLEDDEFPKDRNASAITLREIYIYFGILDIFSVRCPHGAKVDCWSTDPILECPPVKEAMTFKRFCLIKRHLKMASCANLTEAQRKERDVTDRLWRVRELLVEMEHCNQGRFDVGGVKTLDEQIIQMQQKRVPLGLKQHFPNKPISEGVRVESLNDRCGFTMSTLISQDRKRAAEILAAYPDAKEILIRVGTANV
jgi:hypothetical protein